MTGNRTNYPSCFGILDSVFPAGSDSLRHSPESCLSCPYKTKCLKSAMNGKNGLKVKEEKVDRAYNSGRIPFLKRWSQKKHLDRIKKDLNKGGDNEKTDN
ncbi:MAG: hypothetical protein KAH06_01855 [Desulfobacterales bacterium]|nr:hypothetical protein [Desulfobacterales bacterium]